MWLKIIRSSACPLSIQERASQHAIGTTLFTRVEQSKPKPAKPNT